MHKLRLLLACVFALLPAGFSMGMSADELAQFLGVNGWKTVVDLPAETFSIEVWEFQDGAVKDRWIISQPDWTRNPEAGISFIAGPHEGKYKLSFASSAGGILSVKTRVPLFDTTFVPSLPEKVQEGDFILIAQPRTPEAAKAEPGLGQNDLRRYAKGFLLRISKLK